MTLRTLVALARCGALALTLLLIGLQSASAAQNPIILSFGDSLSAAYGLQPEQGWVALLQQRLHDQGYEYQTLNASVSGETSSGGLERLPHLLAGVALHPGLMQADGLHPVAAGEPAVLETVWAALLPLLRH